MATVRSKSQPDPKNIRTIYESAVRLELVAPAKLAAAALEVHDYVEIAQTDGVQDLTTNRLESLRDRVVERLRAAIGTDDMISYDIDELRRRARVARRNTK
jgi:hypothetical protein